MVELIIIGVGLLGLFAIRNEIVFRVMTKAQDIKFSNIEMVLNKTSTERIIEDDYDGNYDLMMLDVRKWRFNDFYPNVQNFKKETK